MVNDVVVERVHVRRNGADTAYAFDAVNTATGFPVVSLHGNAWSRRSLSVGQS